MTTIGEDFDKVATEVVLAKFHEIYAATNKGDAIVAAVLTLANVQLQVAMSDLTNHKLDELSGSINTLREDMNHNHRNRRRGN